MPPEMLRESRKYDKCPSCGSLGLWGARWIRQMRRLIESGHKKLYISLLMQRRQMETSVYIAYVNAGGLPCFFLPRATTKLATAQKLCSPPETTACRTRCRKTPIFTVPVCAGHQRSRMLQDVHFNKI